MKFTDNIESQSGFLVTTFISEGDNIIECFYWQTINSVAFYSYKEDRGEKIHKVAIFKPKGNASIQVQSED